MFSGIITAVGRLQARRSHGRGVALTISSSMPVAAGAGIGTSDRERIGPGDSIAVMGACLTVETVTPPGVFTAVAGAETIARTTLGGLSVGGRLHLERALRVGDRLDGHLVSGHIDGVGTIAEREVRSETVVLWVEAPAELSRYIAQKGSIAVDGVSLTVNELSGGRFRVGVVPFTAGHTLLGALPAGTTVNLEIDLVARYVERLLGDSAPTGGLSAARMRALGYGGSR